MTFSRDVLTAYANKDRDKRTDGIYIISMFAMFLLGGLFYYVCCSSLTKAIIVTLLFLIIYVSETVILLGKYGLTNGYNFLFSALSSALLSVYLLIISTSFMIKASGDYFYALSSTIIYILTFALFIYLCLRRLTRLTVEKINSNKSSNIGSGIGSMPMATILAVSRFFETNSALTNKSDVIISILIYIFSVLFLLASGIILKFIIIKWLKL